MSQARLTRTLVYEGTDRWIDWQLNNRKVRNSLSEPYGGTITEVEMELVSVPEVVEDGGKKG